MIWKKVPNQICSICDQSDPLCSQTWHQWLVSPPGRLRVAALCRVLPPSLQSGEPCLCLSYISNSGQKWSKIPYNRIEKSENFQISFSVHLGSSKFFPTCWPTFGQSLTALMGVRDWARGCQASESEQWGKCYLARQRPNLCNYHTSELNSPTGESSESRV